MPMTPIYWEGRFGWLHDGSRSGGTGTGRTGVVLCPAFGQEEVCTHHGLMALAERLAAAGLPTLRFDYRGTGDATPGEPTLAAMRADIVRAADCLRQQAGVTAVVLAGVRLGATLAFQAADGMAGIAATVMIAPAVSGQAFIRETRAAASVASLSGLEPVPPIDGDLPLIANGFRWPAPLQRAIAEIDLTTAAVPAAPVLVVPGRGDRRSAKLAATWRAAGAEASELPFPDYDGWMQDPTTNATPHATFAAITAWLAALPVAPVAVAPAPPVAIADTLTIGAAVERPVRFGTDDAVFGILSGPAHGPAAPVAALLLHEGSTHHIGNGGAYVTLARDLAAAGIVSLRMDLTGMGDSPAGDNPRHPHYDPERIGEGVAGIDLLDRIGHPRVVAFGLCSGAHTALQVTLADRRVVGNVVLNLQKFIWHYGDDIRVATRDNKRSLRGYVRAMRNPGEWRRMFAGEADLKGIARVLTKRGLARAGHAVRSLLPPAPGSETALVRDQLRDLAERGVQTNLVFSDEDPGLAEMWMQFGSRARRLRAYAPARMVLLDRADHHFNGQAARARHIALALEVMATAIATHGARTTPVSDVAIEHVPHSRAA
jgi:alpha/beta superfamily hydrolase